MHARCPLSDIPLPLNGKKPGSIRNKQNVQKDAAHWLFSLCSFSVATMRTSKK